MPRDGKQVRKRLQLAALELYRDRGYEQTTAADIAGKAGVTERTFFRHFPDKREVLFDGDAAFSDALTSAVRRAPPALGPWDTLFLAFRSVEQIFVENRPFSEPRQRVIASSPALQERAMAKTRSLIAALTSALSERGVPARQASLAAQMGMAALSHAVAAWFGDDTNDLEGHIARAFHDVRDLSSSSSELMNSKQPARKRSRPARATSR
jgi:AcrR family transcriptional regulator